MATALRLLPAFRLAAASQPQVWRAGARRAFSARSALLAKKYTEKHEWVELSSDGKTGVVGISKYAADALGDVVYVELPEIDLEVKQDEQIGAVESVKSASDIYAPVSGKVVENNSYLEEKPGHINKDPEGDGWLAKIELTDPAELDKLMSGEEYANFEKGDH